MCEHHAAGLPSAAARQRPRDGRPAPLRYERTILLIEDDEEMRKLVARVLERDGYEVVAVADGDQALDWLGLCLFDGSLVHVPALIVSDIRLPQFSGLELLEGMLCATTDVPVILITAFPSEETYAEALELGAVRVLAKPFELETLRLAVHAVLDPRPAPPALTLRDRGAGWTKLPA